MEQWVPLGSEKFTLLHTYNCISNHFYNVFPFTTTCGGSDTQGFELPWNDTKSTFIREGCEVSHFGEGLLLLAWLHGWTWLQRYANFQLTGLSFMVEISIYHDNHRWGFHFSHQLKSTLISIFNHLVIYNDSLLLTTGWAIKQMLCKWLQSN